MLWILELLVGFRPGLPDSKIQFIQVPFRMNYPGHQVPALYWAGEREGEGEREGRERKEEEWEREVKG